MSLSDIVPSLLSLPPALVAQDPDSVWLEMKRQRERSSSNTVGWFMLGGYQFCADGRVLRDGVETSVVEAQDARAMLKHRMFPGDSR